MNFALQQSGARFVRRIALINKAPHDLEELVVRAEIGGADAAIARPWHARVARVTAGTTYNLLDVDVALAPELLARQTEREAGEFRVEVASRGNVLGRHSSPLDVLAATEWSGGNEFPEVLAAFVTPNHPAVERLIVDAGRFLREWTGDGAISGYQSRNPARAKAIVAALYTAMAGRGIGYVNPPASFEATGQKVRLADQVLEGKLGTCIDLALVLAAAIEQAGLHPLMVIQRGHAFAGAWLVEETFADPVVDTHSRLVNRVELDEMVVVEAVGVTSTPAMGFDAAALRGRTLLAEKEDFRWALDVRAARRAAVRPLPIRVGGVGGVVMVATEGEGGPAAPESVRTNEREHAGKADASAAEAPRTRVDNWKRKLLDLSLRNRLINFRETSQSVVIECPDVGGLENALAGGARFEILPRPDVLIRGGDAGGAAAERDALAVEERRRVLREEMASRRLRATLAPGELATRLTGIYRAAKMSIDENGANTLFLALGSLVWYESKESQTPRSAPLLMLPMTLERRSAREGFRIVAADEDPRINITLVEKLAQEFGIDAAGLRDVPEDESGVDVAAVLRRFREAIKHIDRWEVKETAQLGLFTFSKFLMWLDLQEREAALRRSRVVNFLVDRPDAPFDAEPFPAPGDLDSSINVSESLAPLDADSSQSVAALAAATGRTFVLEGPPGTGKSQTITNIIAQAVAGGKRVLFVAEKLAALSVVHKRLERVGLAPFCLEVHSNKASKKEVLEQIAKAFDAAGSREPAGWQTLAADLERTRAGLNDLVDRLHSVRPIGRSFFQVAAYLIALSGEADIELRLENVAAVEAAFIDGLRLQLEAVEVAGRAVGDIPTHPLRECGRGDWQDSLPEQSAAAIDAATSALEGMQDGLETLARALGAVGDLDDLQRWSRMNVEWLVRIGTHLVSCTGATMAILTDPGWQSLREQLESLIARGRRRDVLRTQVLSQAGDGVFALDLDALNATLKAGAARSWPLSWLACRSARNAVRMVWKGPLPLNSTLITVLESARECRDETAWLASEASQGARYFGRAYKDGLADWNAIDGAVAWADEMRALSAARPEDALGAVIRSGAIRLATEGIDELQQGSPGGAIRRGLESCRAFDDTWKRLDAMLSLLPDAMPAVEEAEHLPWLRGVLARWRAGLSELNDWCYWRRARQALGPQCEPVAIAVERGRIACERMRPAFEKALARSWVAAVSDATPELRDFNVAAHEGQIARFRDLDRKWLDLAAQIARARVAGGVPPRLNVESGNTPATEMGVLAHQMRLQRRHMPVRRLIGKLPNLLPRLKPCFLMSPLSVAQYLDPAYPPFDLVVFDEASQIPVWDAVGAIARGTSVIVVGDSKQLPPTNFFQKLDGEDAGDEEDFEELESVLDECVASGLPSMRLLWHYRSRHESLIAFSNHHYYQGSLLTFPVPEDRGEGLGVSMRHIAGGTYDRGGSRTNRAEAEAVVADLVARLAARPPASGASVGVVTFSSAQQSLIEDLIDARRRDDSTFDAAMNAGEEPVFIKNLENVQGDERDVILFSVGYAPDRNGRMVMSFGPLNRDGGERRLNVAVTRARREVVVFSSIRADQIDLNRTRAVGAMHLKSFLEYAERGPAAIGEAIADTVLAEPSPLEMSVKSELESRGWSVDARIGCSGYRVDLAVRDPDRQGRYLLGIECDGAFYAAASTARDRDRLRGQVLSGLGWRLHRVWSVEWRRNRAKALQRIEDAIRAAQRGERATAGLEQSPAERVMNEPASAVEEPRLGMPSVGSEETAPRPYSPYTARRAGDSEAFHQPRATTKIAESIRAVVEHEGPIVLGLMIRRVSSLWGVERVTTRVEARIAEVLAAHGRVVRVDADGVTLWPTDVSPESFTTYRSHGEEAEARRDAEHVPTREIANAAASVLRTHVAMSVDELLRHTAAELGFSRPTERIAAEMRRGVADLVRRGGCEVSEGQARLPR